MIRKSSAGYNLTNLFIGSEGTLGIVTEITLKLAVVPQETSVAVVTFPTIRDAAAAASKILRAGVPVAAMEIMDEVQMGVINKAGSTTKKWKELPTMFFKYVAQWSSTCETNRLTMFTDSRARKQGYFSPVCYSFTRN